MLDTSARYNGSTWLAINENFIAHSLDTNHGKVDSMLIETQLPHHGFKEGPFDTVKAFAISSLIAMLPLLPLCLIFIVCSASKAVMILLVTIHLGIKALWEEEMMDGKIFLSLFARTLEASLYVHRLIGLKSLRLAEILTLGMSTM